MEHMDGSGTADVVDVVEAHANREVDQPVSVEVTPGQVPTELAPGLGGTVHPLRRAGEELIAVCGTPLTL